MVMNHPGNRTLGRIAADLRPEGAEPYGSMVPLATSECTGDLERAQSRHGSVLWLADRYAERLNSDWPPKRAKPLDVPNLSPHNSARVCSSPPLAGSDKGASFLEQHRTEPLPSDAKLQITKGYAPMFGQLSRVLVYLATRVDGSRVPGDDIVQATGLSAPHAGHLQSILAAMGLLLPRVLRLSDLGRAVAAHDPYFGDLGTLWLCHYQIASNPRHIVWNRCCNDLLPAARGPIALSASNFADLADQYTENTLKKHVVKEIRSFVRAYTVHRFRNLNYLYQVDGRCCLGDAPAPVPPLILLATIVAFRDAVQPGASGLEIPLLCRGANSPGRILHLGDWKLRTALEGLSQQGQIEIESRANLDQMRFAAHLSPAQLLIAHHEVH
jgi:hypothetical protein